MRSATSKMYNFKNVKNTHRGVLLLVKLQAKTCFLKTAFRCFSCFFLNFTYGTKSPRIPHILYVISITILAIVLTSSEFFDKHCQYTT